MKKYADGGIYTAEMGKPPMDPEGVPMVKKKPEPKMQEPKKPAPRDTVFREGMPVPKDIDGASVKKMAKGGSASARADGCATKGKTRGTMIAMCGGGMAKRK
jgi:hypothetical protein